MEKRNVKRKRIKFRPEDTPGVICIERRQQGDAIHIFGTMKIDCNLDEMADWVEQAIKKAAADVKASGGVLGQIKMARTVTNEEVLALFSEDIIDKETSCTFTRISLATAMFMENPKDAENIIRNVLADIRTKVRAKSAPSPFRAAQNPKSRDSGAQATS